MKKAELEELFRLWQAQDPARSDTYLTTYSPGDGKTRYAIVKGSDNYFGGRRILWTIARNELVTALRFAIECDHLTER